MRFSDATAMALDRLPPFTRTQRPISASTKAQSRSENAVVLSVDEKPRRSRGVARGRVVAMLAWPEPLLDFGDVGLMVERIGGCSAESG
jgi:hypothetical protein